MLALVGRALCFRFVGGAVVVLLLLEYAACMVSRMLLHMRYGIAEAGVYYSYCCRYSVAIDYTEYSTAPSRVSFYLIMYLGIVQRLGGGAVVSQMSPFWKGTAQK